MTRTNVTILILALLAGATLTRLGPVSDSANADVTRRALDSALTALPAAVLAHCEIPCGIYDDNMMVRQMLLDAETIAKASAQITALASETDAAHLNTIARWAMVKEEHSRDLQHMNAWYFMTQRVKAVPVGDPGHASYLEKLAAHHAISVAAMKAAQSLDPAAQGRLVAAIKVVEPWYPPKDAGALLPVDDGNWTRIADRVRP
jgi:nickel superoxide dismutase